MTRRRIAILPSPDDDPPQLPPGIVPDPHGVQDDYDPTVGEGDALGLLDDPDTVLDLEQLELPFDENGHER